MALAKTQPKPKKTVRKAGAYCNGCGQRVVGVMLFDGNNRALCLDCYGDKADYLRGEPEYGYDPEPEDEED